MRFDFAPMEGVTDYSYRMAHSRFFPGMDRYLSPFIAANATHSMKTREKKDVAPEHNSGVVLVPQILTNNAEAFLWAAKCLQKSGYREVNLNLGCPSPTVFTHGKGAGFLREVDRLDAFFEEVFRELSREGAARVQVSVKTRIGIDSPEEARPLLQVFRRYPLCNLMVHPRLRKDFYQGQPDLDTYELFYEEYPGPLTYNGDLYRVQDLAGLLQRFPKTEGVMIGRGLITNPALVREMQGGAPLKKEELEAFHEAVFAARMGELQGFLNTAGKMKELWYYMGSLFAEADREIKAIKKARTEEAYRLAVQRLFATRELKESEV